MADVIFSQLRFTDKGYAFGPEDLSFETVKCSQEDIKTFLSPGYREVDDYDRYIPVKKNQLLFSVAYMASLPTSHTQCYLVKVFL